MHLEDETGDIYQKILAELAPADGQFVSSARIIENLDEDRGDIHDAIRELLRFGELEFINASGSGGHARVRLHRPAEDQSSQRTLADAKNQYHWLAYIADERSHETTRSRRLFTNRDAAEQHLKFAGAVMN